MNARHLVNQSIWLCAAAALLVAGCGDDEACNLGTTKCGEICVDTSIDTRNCGSCYTSCKAGEVCSSGKCTLSCQSTLTNCSGTCANLTADSKNCGACGTKCATAEVCASGKCASQCPSSLSTCSGACVNTNTDRDNCGKCDTKCKAGEVCSSGKCALSCQSELTDCSSVCVNLKKDPTNCGACGTKCNVGEVCSAGKCALSCPSKLTDCSGSCANLQKDPTHCGKCGTKCKAGEVCSDGKCALSCQSSLTDCSGLCVNVQTDLANCGKCGTKCNAGEACSAGKCALSCPTGMAICSNTCVNLQTDLAHCGKCATKCKAGEVCSAGKCALTCQVGLTACNNTCVNLQKDSAHCGKCGSACSYGTVCSGGSCKASCGNKTVDPGEQCDGVVPAGATCATLGHDGGTLACTSKCAFDTTKCYRCGDGVVSSPPEECDGAAFGGKTCKSLGYSGGTLACLKCKIDSGACTLPETCGNPSVLDISKGSVKIKMSTKAASKTISLSKGGCTKDVTPGPDLFFSVNLVGGFTYKFTLTPEAAFDPAMYLFTSCAMAEATCAGGSDQIGAGKVETITFSPKANGTFLIAVDSYSATSSSGSGSFTLEAALLSPGQWATVSGGAFMMGAPAYEACRLTNEDHHQVMLTNKYQISKTEVTQAQYQAIMGSNPAYHATCGGQCPVERVNWSMAANYCNNLSKLMGYKECYTCNGSGTSVSCSATASYTKEKVYTCPGYRLPTEAEWERAYRAGTSSPFYNGNNDGPVCSSCTLKDSNADLIAWYCFNGSNTTHPVGQKTANNLGMFDMAGNVYELCHDVYQDQLGATPKTDPWGASTGTDRVIRSGSYSSGAYSIRAATRWKNELIKAYINVGFRCARTVK